MYAIGVIIGSERRDDLYLRADNASLVVDALDRASACIQLGFEGREDDPFPAFKRNDLPPFIAAVESPTRWRKSLRALDRANNSLPNRLRSEVVEALAELRATVLTLSGVPRELSRRVRSYVLEAWRRALVVLKTSEAAVAYFADLGMLTPDQEATSQTAQRTVAAAETVLVWLRRAAEQAGFEPAQLDEFAKLPSATAATALGQPPPPDSIETNTSIIKSPKTLALLRSRNVAIATSLDAAALAIDARPALAPGERALGADEARRIFFGVSTMIDDGRLVSRALQKVYDAKTDADAAAAVNLEQLTQQLRAEEQQSLQEQEIRNRALLNAAVLAQIDIFLSNATAVALAEPRWDRYAQLIQQTRAVIENVEQTLDAKEFATRVASLLRDLRTTAQQAATLQASIGGLFGNYVRAVHHLAVAGHVMRAELVLASWLDESDAQRADLEAPLRSAEHVIAQRAALDLRATLQNSVAPNDAASADWKLFLRYRAAIEALGDASTLDYVPIPSAADVEKIAQFLKLTAAERAEWAHNLVAYDTFQQQYYDTVVQRLPRSSHANPLAAPYSDVVLNDEQAVQLVSQLAAARDQLERRFTEALRDPTSTQTAEAVRIFYQQLRDALNSIFGGAAPEDRSRVYYNALQAAIEIVDNLYNYANNLLAPRIVRVQPAAALLFDAFRFVQTEAARLLQADYNESVKLPTPAERALPWKPEFDPVLRDQLQRLLQSAQ